MEIIGLIYMIFLSILCFVLSSFNFTFDTNFSNFAGCFCFIGGIICFILFVIFLIDILKEKKQ